ncbi:IclR family transcriptional regulator [Massilia niastensis]|uniref:IclR family transcriptional regulator n=1 Tax=Massilia niastensis TaxID=544911 RepID=UPI000368457A|nr:IclR family transcriptional regulator [Massilia niastensis]
MGTVDDGSDIQRFDEDEQGKDRQFVIALARGLELLRCFGSKEREIGISELARRAGIPKPTVARLAGTLAKLGYLEHLEAEGKYRLGAGVLALGYSMLSRLDVREVARPFMRELAERSQASVSLGVRDRLSMVYVESVRSSASITLQRGVGTRLALATTAMGRACLAAMPAAERAFLLDQIRLRDEHDWPRLQAGIEQALRDHADYGFCMSIGEWDKDTCGVGVPFLAPDGMMMAFNCGMPAFKCNREYLQHEVGPLLVELVRKIGGSLGQGAY